MLGGRGSGRAGAALPAAFTRGDEAPLVQLAPTEGGLPQEFGCWEPRGPPSCFCLENFGDRWGKKATLTRGWGRMLSWCQGNFTSEMGV